jgi:hypothetical protein
VWNVYEQEDRLAIASQVRTRDRDHPQDVPTFDPKAPEISSDVPMIIGGVRTESELFLGLADESVFHLTWDSLPTKLAAMNGMMQLRGDLPEEIRKARETMPKASPAKYSLF